jgi:tryptophan 2,3-dioxygenase
LRKICIHRSKTETHLEGLLWSKPMTYWDYIQTDALLNIQTQRTTLPDEMVLSCIINEWVDIQDDSLGNETNLLWKYRNCFFTERLMRISRYFDMLTTLSVLWKMGWKINTWSSETLWLLRAVFKAPSID